MGYLLLFYTHPPPTPPTLKTWEIRIFKKWKKLLEISLIILHMHTKNHNHMRYTCWDTEWDTEFLVIMGHFLPFYTHTLPKNPENQFWKNEKSIWRCYHFTHVYQKSWSYNVCFLRYGVHQTLFFFILGHFCAFNTLLTPKIKIWKKCKKNLEILSFYTCVP